jgi:hypothetical protein
MYEGKAKMFIVAHYSCQNIKGDKKIRFMKTSPQVWNRLHQTHKKSGYRNVNSFTHFFYFWAYSLCIFVCKGRLSLSFHEIIFLSMVFAYLYMNCLPDPPDSPSAFAAVVIWRSSNYFYRFLTRHLSFCDYTATRIIYFGYQGHTLIDASNTDI